MTAETTDLPAFPMARKSGCPFDPAPELYTAQRDGAGKPTQVRVMDGSAAWLITKHDQAKSLFSDSRISNDATIDGYPIGFKITKEMQESIGFILMDGPEHARQRRMVTAPFTVKRIQGMRPFVEQVVNDQVDHLLSCEKPADLVEEFALPVPSLVICDFLGVPYEDHQFFQEASRKIVSRNATPEERAEGTGSVVAYLQDLIAKKAENPGDDIISGLAPRVAAGELTAEQAGQLGNLLLFAGHETTANMIALGTDALLRHPDQLTKLQTGDQAIAVTAVEELLRYLNITHNGPKRVAIGDVEIDGVTIREGEGVLLPGEIINRDPDVFEDPDTLDIERTPNRHLAFSFGVHQCLGQQLARLELEIVFSTLYRRIPTLALAGDPDELEYKHDGFVYGVRSLPVTW